MTAESRSGNEREIRVYTDGGCSGNPGIGGWAFALVEPSADGERQTTRSGGEEYTTNNRMELTAVIRALEEAKRLFGAGARVCVYTDSQYVQKGITVWINAWKRNGWLTSAKQPVKNCDLWKRLDALALETSPRWVWVKGHAGIKYNELADALTQAEIARLR